MTISTPNNITVLRTYSSPSFSRGGSGMTPPASSIRHRGSLQHLQARHIPQMGDFSLAKMG
jgi:hypothetical protein